MLIANEFCNIMNLVHSVFKKKEIHTVTAAFPDAWDPPVFGPTLAMACCIAWLNISVVMRLPPDEGPAAEDVPEPVERLDVGNNPDHTNKQQVRI
jgi:hypothetical protein